MDGWLRDDAEDWALFSSESLSSELIDAYRATVFMGSDSGEIELGMSTLSNDNIEMETNHLFVEEFIQHQRSEEFFVPNHSSLQSLEPIPVVARSHQTSMQAYKRYDHPCFAPLSSDDVEIMRAMAAVISSSSSSSSSPSSSILYQPLQQARTHESQTDGQFGAFKPYNSTGDEAKTQESRSTNIKLQHIISERLRREKLNGSFHSLRLLLPPGSKKDKGSVLANTRNYLNRLKAQISKLQEENRVLEMRLSPTTETKEVDGSIEKVKIQIAKGFELTSGVQHIEFEISVRVECDVVELVLRMLEYLKGMRVSSLISIDVKICSQQMDLFARAKLALEIKASDWDEESFKEAMNWAVKGATTTL